MHKRNISIGILVLLLFLSANIGIAQTTTHKKLTKEDYVKKQYDVPMRDGVKLHTMVYSPKDQSQKYPILMTRTPYSCAPYDDSMPRQLSSNPYMVQDGFIFVCQDVRGRWASEGKYSTLTPNIPGPEGPDESSDTYDTVDWLIHNVPNNNGKVGQYGISYPGFYTSAALPDAHPALVASSPQAPISDFFFDDFHHQGAYLMSYWYATNVFGYQHDVPSDTAWYSMPDVKARDAYWFYLNHMEPLTKASKYYKQDNFFWQELINHPNYDKFWQSRNILPYLKDIHHPVLTVGGWFDAEDLYGAINTYKAIEKQNPGIKNMIVMGPWSHGEWSRGGEHNMVGNIYFGDNLSDFYKKNIEFPFFAYYLKGEGSMDLPEAYMFDTGRKKWSKFDKWPPRQAKKQSWYVHDDGALNNQKPSSSEKEYSEYVSDIKHPVPYKENPEIRFTPRPYMTSDQRFAARRPDVLTFETPVLDKDVTLAGPILAKLRVSTSGTASDWVVKLIDVYPPDTPNSDYTPAGINLGNYHQMVRSEVMRGRFRNSYEKPEPFTPGKVTQVNLPLQDVFHTFKKGHKIQIQIQSTFFPLIDLNPQKYVPNIYKAKASDFQNATQRVYHTAGNATSIEVEVLPQQN